MYSVTLQETVVETIFNGVTNVYTDDELVEWCKESKMSLVEVNKKDDHVEYTFENSNDALKFYLFWT